MFVFVDTETTGLDPATAEVLEVACIITDDQLNEIARYQQVVYSATAHKAANMLPRQSVSNVAHILMLDPVVVEMHRQNGLWKESVRGVALATAEQELRDLIDRHSVNPIEADKPRLAGSSVWFDRAVLKQHMPTVLGALHYRVIDLSTLTELASRFWPLVHAARPKSRRQHRALPDLEDSLEGIRYFTKALGSVPSASKAFVCEHDRPCGPRSDGSCA